jgi:hypothetical protein
MNHTYFSCQIVQHERTDICQKERNTEACLQCSITLNYKHLLIFIHSSMSLQPFVGPWPLLQFRNLFYTDGRIPWTSDQSIARPLPTHRTTQTQNERTHTDIHALRGIRTHDPSIRASEDSSCLRPRGRCDRQYLPIWSHIYAH